MEDGGGILLGPNGMMELAFAWDLGSVLNNRAKALALWQGLRLAAARNIQNLVVFRDSRVIIQTLKTQRNPSQVNLGQILKKTSLLLHKFKKVWFFHILQGLNISADSEENKGILMIKGVLSVDGVETLSLIP